MQSCSARSACQLLTTSAWLGAAQWHSNTHVQGKTFKAAMPWFCLSADQGNAGSENPFGNLGGASVEQGGRRAESNALGCDARSMPEGRKTTCGRRVSPGRAFGFSSRTIPAESAKTGEIPHLARKYSHRKCNRISTDGPNLAPILAWGARGPEFKSRQPDQISVVKCFYCSILSFRRVRDLRRPCENRARTRSIGPLRVRTPWPLVRLTIQFGERLAHHTQLGLAV